LDQPSQITLWKIPGATMLASYSVSIPETLLNVQWVAVDPDLKSAAIGGDTLQVIDLTTGKPRWSVKSDYGEFDGNSVFSDDGKLLITIESLNASRLRLWDVKSGVQLGPAVTGHHHLVDDLVLWPDGGRLATASVDGTIRLWDVHDPARVQPLGTPLRGQAMGINVLALSPDGKTLFSGREDGSIYAWDTTRIRRQAAPIQVPGVVSWQFTPDGRSVVTVDRRGQVSQWRGTDFQVKDPVLEIGANFARAEFSGDARLLAAGFPHGLIRVWDLSRRSPPRDLPCPGQLLEHSFAPGTRQLVFCEPAKELFHLWDVETFHELKSWAAPKPVWAAPMRVNASAISSGGQRSLAVSSDGKAFLQEIATDRSAQWELGMDHIVDVNFSPSGRLFAVESRNGHVQIWETASQRLAATAGNQLPRTFALQSIAFSPDSLRFLTARGGTEALALWDVESQRQLLVLQAEGNRFGLPRFSSDGCLLGCQSTEIENVLYLWRAPSWAEIEAAERTNPYVQ